MTWFWLCEKPQVIPSRVRLELERESDRWGLSAASVLEIARKNKVFSLTPDRAYGLNLRIPVRTWLERALDPEDYALIDINAKVAVEANELPGEFYMIPWINWSLRPPEFTILQ